MVEHVTTLDSQIIGSICNLLSQLTSQTIEFNETALQQLIDDESSHLFIIRHHGSVVGMLTLGSYISPTGRKAWIEDVVVDKAHRGSGYGKSLVNHAIHFCQEQLSPCSLMLTSNPTRVEANALYRTKGFEQKITNVYKLNCLPNE